MSLPLLPATPTTNPRPSSTGPQPIKIEIVATPVSSSACQIAINVSGQRIPPAEIREIIRQTLMAFDHAQQQNERKLILPSASSVNKILRGS